MDSANALVPSSSRAASDVSHVLSPSSLSEEMKELGKYLTPFDEEIRPFLARMRALPPPPRLTPVAGGAGAILNSPESLGEFLSIRKHFVSAIQDLTAVQTLLSTRVEMLGAFGEEQQRLFAGLEKDVVQARAQQAKLDDQIDTHMEMQKHLGVRGNNNNTKTKPKWLHATRRCIALSCQRAPFLTAEARMRTVFYSLLALPWNSCSRVCRLVWRMNVHVCARVRVPSSCSNLRWTCRVSCPFSFTICLPLSCPSILTS